MTRILILILFMLWLVRDPGQPSTQPPSATTLLIFLGFYALLVGAMGAWGRWLARRVATAHFQKNLRRFNLAMEGARILVPIWFGFGILVLGWALMVEHWLGWLVQALPGVVIGTLPAFLAWAGLWWAQYPADRAMREQNLLALLDTDSPMHAPPGFRSYMMSNLRLQVLFMGVPVLLIVLGHDIGTVLIKAAQLRGSMADNVDFGVWLLSTGVVFLLAPEILRRVLHTERLADSPLRRRLDALCHRTGVRYRDILLWKTDYNMGNAAVMGFVPRIRYILLSDVLLEQMPDDEIEAVFAHEMGHIVHRHMAWYVVFILVLSLINAGPGKWVGDVISNRFGSPEVVEPTVLAVFFMVKFLLLFGFVSRRLERQADVYAARTLQMNHAEPDAAAMSRQTMPSFITAGSLATSGSFALAGAGDFQATMQSPMPVRARISPARLGEPSPQQSHVGPYGARLFASALRRVAMVNNIPMSARSWCHGSIATRMQYLTSLSVDPQRTGGFDRFMFWMYASMLGALVVAGVAFAFMM